MEEKRKETGEEMLTELQTARDLAARDSAQQWIRTCFSKLGLVFLGGSLLVIAVQAGALAIGLLLCPEWRGNDTVLLLLSTLPYYLLAVPLFVLAISRIRPVGKLKETSMSPRQLALAFLMSVGLLYACNLLGIMLTGLIGMLKGTPVENVLAEAITGCHPAVVFLVTVLCAPVAEELIFRKLLIDRAAVYGEGVAVLISGLSFGLFHGNLGQLAYALPLGMFFAFLYVKTGRVRYTIFLHMAINFLGGCVGPWIIERIRYEEFLELMQTSPSPELMMPYLAGLLVLLGYVVLVLAAAVAGIILLFVYRKRFILMAPENGLTLGQKASAMFANPGMVLFLLFWLVQIVWNLF